MYLRRLEIHGFKAFADRQRFEFGPGMTVIVGPNGSGKSNVADAIRWALGEQSARQIRARKTEDVIFAGSDQRRQMGLAEVTLTLDNSGGWMPVDFTEVTVTRRAYRSGDNEYLINNQRVRLQDVHDLFRRAQVGQNSYAMMSQGLVDEVLALRPSERRELIEEAAQVRRHRQQLVLSERRLVETRDNLGRVRILIRELAPRLRQLERQSARAKQYRTLEAELQQSLTVYYEEELRAAHDGLAAARAGHDQHAQDFAAARDELKRLDTRLEQFASTLSERRDALDSLQQRERALAEEQLRLEQSVALAEQRLELLGVRREQVQSELAAGAETDPEPTDADPNADPNAEPDTEISGIAALDLRVEEAHTALGREREALRSADEAARSVLRDLAEAEAKRARLEAELADARRRIEEEERRSRRRDADREAAGERRATLLDELRALGVRALEIEHHGDRLDEASQEARHRRGEMERRLEERLRLLIEARDAVRVAEARGRQLEERQTMLARIAEQAPVSGAGGGAVIAASRQRDEDDEPLLTGIVGAISQLINVPDGLEVAIEAALAEQLTAIVVEREQDALAAVEYLREQEAGTATVFPLESISHGYPLNLFNERGVVGVAARLVRTEQRYRPLVDTLLGRIIVVDELETARRMIKRGLGSVVTRDGVLLRPGGAYYGGRAGAGAEQFSLRRELEAMPEQIEEAARVAGLARERLDGSERTIIETREGVDRARDGVDQADELRAAHQRKLAVLRREQAALASEMRIVRLALGADEEDAENAGALRRRLDGAGHALETAGTEIATQRDRSDAIVAERDAVAERVTAATAQLAAHEGTRRAAIDQIEERRETRRRAQERRRQLRAQGEELRTEIEDLELALRELREQAANNRSALAFAQAAIGPAHAALAERTSEERELTATRGDLQARLLAAEGATLEAESRLRERAQRVQTLMQQLADEGLVVSDDGTVRLADRPVEEEAKETAETAETAETDEAEKAEEAAVAPVRGGASVDATALRARISELRGEIRALGPVNVEAPEDLGEERQRHDFLSEQVDDLEAAEKELREAIGQLRREIRARFDECFEKVNTAFGDYFQRFFGGGSAGLTLLEAAEGEDPGVDITAQPPGKRISSLHVLSGGERALTSVALLFALLSVNPAPICVLDEVDAALDEANVGRFLETLRELCDRSQFIVISHNRRTVEASDAIYGISMGEDSTTEVLSLRLADVPQAS